MRLALYVRVSTKDKQDPETQLIPLRDFARAKGYEIVGEYIDVGWSGSKERRPELDRLMRDAKAKRLDAVVVVRFDRFARSIKHLIIALDQFNKLHIEFISLSENVDTSTAMGRLVFHILAAVGEMERALIRERVQAGIDRAKRQGTMLGRPRASIDFKEASRMLAEGATIYAIAKHFHTSRSSVRRAFERGQNPTPAR